MQAKVNPEFLDDRKVFITRPQDGFTLKSKAKKQERIQPITPVKSRYSMHKSGLMQGRRLFSEGEDTVKPKTAANDGEGEIDDTI